MNVVGSIVQSKGTFKDVRLHSTSLVTNSLSMKQDDLGRLHVPNGKLIREPTEATEMLS
jgi:hypothetical protein